jgi:hypothetical protein
VRKSGAERIGYTTRQIQSKSNTTLPREELDTFTYRQQQDICREREREQTRWAKEEKFYNFLF